MVILFEQFVAEVAVVSCGAAFTLLLASALFYWIDHERRSFTVPTEKGMAPEDTPEPPA